MRLQEWKENFWRVKKKKSKKNAMNLMQNIFKVL